MKKQTLEMPLDHCSQPKPRHLTWLSDNIVLPTLWAQQHPHHPALRMIPPPHPEILTSCLSSHPGPKMGMEHSANRRQDSPRTL